MPLYVPLPTASASTLGGVKVGTNLSIASGVLSGQAAGLVKINETILGASAATFSFTGIPSSYRHLRLVLQVRCDGNNNGTSALMQFNGDSGGNYDWVEFWTGGGTATGRTFNTTQAAGAVGSTSGANSSASVASATTIDIPNYAGTTFDKDWIALSVVNQTLGSTNPNVVQDFGTWRSTAAITSILLYPSGSSNWIAGSVATLYGTV